MRKRGLETVYRLAKEHPNVVYIGSDVGKGTLAQFQEEMPERFFVEGIAEAYVIGMAAGLAMSGKMPFVNTIATFLTRRCYDQIAVDVCLGNYDVRLYANGGGLVYAPLGPTHQSIDDIALMRALPNMTVFCPCDADEMERGIRASYDHKGPVYIRVARGGDPIVSKAEAGFAFGKALVFKQPGDLLLISTGITCQISLKVIEALAERGISAGLCHLPTVKPLDRDTLEPLLRQSRFVATVEEHSVIGGLGGAVAQLIAEGARHPAGKFKSIGIPDVFPQGYGRQENLLARYGLDVDSVTQTVTAWMEQT
ncbi:MAG: transketolase C-terminal domain-containing protein [Acidobacteriota bacterium]|nr:transketolase C-terminal domain-containing protein [Acidobacteriota bacterium]